MSYAFAAIVYVVCFSGIALSVLYTMGTMFLGSGQYGASLGSGFWLFQIAASLVNLVLLTVPASMVSIRWWDVRRQKTDLLPASFRSSKRFGYLSGLAFIYLGHITLLITLGLITYYSGVGATGLPLGLGLGWALLVYAVGIACVEVSIRRWKSAQRKG